jgi:hypothetical protein
MSDEEADALLALGTREALERVASESSCHSGRNQGSDWCRACAAKDRLRRLPCSAL